MEIKVTLTDEEIKDILTTAQCGGSTYWARTHTDLEDALKGDDVSVFDAENPEKLLGILTRDNLHEAMNRLCTMRLTGKLGAHVFVQFFEHAQGEIGCVDANAADVFLQAALFNDVVYG